MFQFLCMFYFCAKNIYFMQNYIILHYVRDVKYGDQSSFIRVSLIMPIGDMQWRVEIEMFNSKNKTRFINEKSLL